MEEGAVRKKARLAGEEDLHDRVLHRGDSPSRIGIRQANISTIAFGLYRRHLDSLDEEENGEENGDRTDMSDINALIQLIEANGVVPFQEPLSSVASAADMLGILASVAYYQLASTALEGYLEGSKEARLLQEAQSFVDLSLKFFGRNAACRSMGANIGRMTETLSKESVTQWYQTAARDAQRVQREALVLLDQEHEDGSVQEWMELLLLNQVVKVEYLASESADEDGDDGDDADGYFSSSSVEGMSRFMAAMLLSRDGHHTSALRELKSFSTLTHRLHPNVWTGRDGNSARTATLATLPVSFRSVLPPRLYQRMCDVFAADAAFWRESDYANQGYYSFLVDITDKPQNLIDDVVINHLLPLTKQMLGSEAGDICAYEWWAHSRHASLGHMLHFDTDEANLEPDQAVHHPLMSSVLHLTGDETSGATIILDQTPDSTDVAHVCWRSVPHPNTFMVFPGNLLHGVLPCPGTDQSRGEKPAFSSRDVPTKKEWIQAPTTPSQRRLTFMIGFKTRRVPDQRQDESLYGPCAPIPPNTHEWVKEIERGYKDTATPSPPREENLPCSEVLPQVSPAWERLVANTVTPDNQPPLQLPAAMDLRFFVKGAPEFFRNSLLEHDSD
jgi:hypothetical protein